MRASSSVTVTVPQRLDRAVQSLTGLSRARVRGLLDHDCVRVNDETCTAGQRMLAPGDAVVIEHDPHTVYREKAAPPRHPAFDILHEDEYLIVVNKAAHILTVPTDREGEGVRGGVALVEALERSLNHGRPPRLHRRLHVVHRLDRGVSGVLVFARRPDVAAKLKQQFGAHKPQRVYIAIVNGIMHAKSGTFRSQLATDASLNRYSTRRPGQGERAVTHYEVIAHARGATLLRVRLETGRRNQIRVHFAEAGHPVLGDRRYPLEVDAGSRRRGGKIAQPPLPSTHPKWKARRLALHAHSLAFVHPVTGQAMKFVTDLPAEFTPFMPAVTAHALQSIT